MMSQDYKYNEKTGAYEPVNEKKQEKDSSLGDGDEKIIAIVFWAIQFLSSMFWPLIVTIIGYAYFKDKSKFLSNSARHALNFQITFFVGLVLVIGLAFTIVGLIAAIPLGLALLVYNIAIPIIGIMEALSNRVYKPHFTIEVIKE
jgi:uncharacterized Tic20 family protein